MKLVIDRKRWLRGEGGNDGNGNIKSFLYRSRDKKMCCLGFLARTCGVKIKEMKDVAEPANLPKALHTKFPRKPNTLALYWYDGYPTLMEINDDLGLNESEREELIIEHMNNLGVEVTFK